MDLPRTFPGSAFSEYSSFQPSYYSGYPDAYGRAPAYTSPYDVTARPALGTPAYPKPLTADNYVTSPWPTMAPTTESLGLGRPPEMGSSPAHHVTKRKRKTTPQQRLAANIRERRRMCNLNNAFDRLRRRVPAFPHEKRLSRIQTLKLAITYISFMTEIVSGQDIETLIKQNQENNKHVVWQPYELGESGSESGGSATGFL